jgi:hypothetical protein
MAQAVSVPSPIVEARVHAQVSPREICGGQIGIGAGFPPSIFRFPLSVSFHQCSIPIFILILLLKEGQAGEAWEPSKK